MALPFCSDGVRFNKITLDQGALKLLQERGTDLVLDMADANKVINVNHCFHRILAEARGKGNTIIE